jgi:hypothetical protein
MTETKIGETQVPTRGHQGLPSAEAGELHGTDSPLEPLEGTNPINTLILDQQPTEGNGITLPWC